MTRHRPINCSMFSHELTHPGRSHQTEKYNVHVWQCDHSHFAAMWYEEPVIILKEFIFFSFEVYLLSLAVCV